MPTKFEKEVRNWVPGLTDRKYNEPKGYASWITVMADMAGYLYRAVLEYEDDRTGAHICSNFGRFWQDRGTCYWVDEALEEQLYNTEPPEGVEYPKVFNTALVFLKKGIKVGNDVINWFVVSHVFMEDVTHLDEDLLLYSDYFNLSQSFVCISTITKEGLAFKGERLIKREFKSDVLEEEFNARWAEGLSSLEEEERKAIEQCLSLACQCILILATEPSLVTESEPKNPRSKGFRKSKGILNPRWIGKGYKRPVQRVDHGSTHASPQTHWRIGHWRRQPYGPKLEKKKKWVWIQPMLVNAKVEDEGVRK